MTEQTDQPVTAIPGAHLASVKVVAKTFRDACEKAYEDFGRYFGQGWRVVGSQAKWNDEMRQFNVELVAMKDDGD